LLVSHWVVYSDATVQLMTAASARWPAIQRLAERRSMQERAARGASGLRGAARGGGGGWSGR